MGKQGKSNWYSLFWIGIVIIILGFGVLFLSPVIKYQAYTIEIVDGNTPKIVNMGVDYFKSPILSVFAKSNPKGDYSLNVLILDMNNKEIINSNIYNVGEGITIVPIKGSLNGTYSLKSTLSYNNNFITSMEEKFTIK